MWLRGKDLRDYWVKRSSEGDVMLIANTPLLSFFLLGKHPDLFAVDDEQNVYRFAIMEIFNIEATFHLIQFFFQTKQWLAKSQN